MATQEERDVQEKILEIEQLRKKRKKKNRRRQLISLALLAAFVLLVFQMENIGKALNISSFFAEIFSPGGGYPVSLDGQELKDLTVYRGDIAVLTDTSFSVYSPSARNILTLQHAYTQPAVSTEYNKILLFDRQGRSFAFYEEDKLCFDKETEYAILDGIAASDGRCAIATLAKGYSSKVTIYNTVGAEAYSWSSLDTYVMHMDFQSDNGGLAVSGVSMQDGQVGTSVTSLRFDSENVSWKVHFAGEVPLYTAYAPNGQLIVITDTALRFLNGDGSVAAQYDFGSSTLMGFSADDTTTPVLLLEAYDGAVTSSVVTVNNNGSEAGRFSVSGTIRDMDADGGKIYLLTSNGFSRYAPDGTADEWSGQEVTDGRRFLITGGVIYAYTADRITRISL